MDLNRFLTNVDATKKVLNTDTQNVMLSTLSTLDQSFDEGQGIIGDLSYTADALQDATTYVEQVIIAENKQNERVLDQEEAIVVLENKHFAEMETAQDKRFAEQETLLDLNGEYTVARSQYDEKEYDLSYWEGQAMQIVNNLNNQIAALQSGAASLGIDISTEKYETLVDKLEDNMNHDKIDWTR
jgi:hypothetical protein